MGQCISTMSMREDIVLWLQTNGIVVAQSEDLTICVRSHEKKEIPRKLRFLMHAACGMRQGMSSLLLICEGSQSPWLNLAFAFTLIGNGAD